MLTLRNGSLGALQLVLMSLALQLVATRAFATVGEPVTVELVGYDVRDQKIYYLTHIYELPRLSFIRIAGPNAGRVVIARSYYAKPYRPDGQDPAFFPKVKRLRRRLKRLKPIAEARRASAQTDGGRRLPRGVEGVSIARKVVKRWRDAEFDVGCRKVVLTLERRGATGNVELNECGPKARVTAIYDLPDHQATFVIVASKPDVWEGGYLHEVPVLLRTAVPTMTPPSSQPSVGKCANRRLKEQRIASVVRRKDHRRAIRRSLDGESRGVPRSAGRL
jgi:hypothetical protein